MNMCTEGLRIDVPLAEYSKRRDVVLKECFLTLYPTYITYKCVARYEELDNETSVWTHKDSNYRYTITKDKLSGVDMYKDNEEDMWSLDMHFDGKGPTGWFFSDPKECLRVYNIIADYMTGKEYK